MEERTKGHWKGKCLQERSSTRVIQKNKKQALIKVLGEKREGICKWFVDEEKRGIHRLLRSRKERLAIPRRVMF